MGGPPLGRPPGNISKEDKNKDHEYERIRIAIDGTFGQAEKIDLSKVEGWVTKKVMAMAVSDVEGSIAITR